jgi:hypothetical protein
MSDDDSDVSVEVSQPLMLSPLLSLPCAIKTGNEDDTASH